MFYVVIPIHREDGVSGHPIRHVGFDILVGTLSYYCTGTLSYEVRFGQLNGRLCVSKKKLKKTQFPQIWNEYQWNEKVDRVPEW